VPFWHTVCRTSPTFRRATMIRAIIHLVVDDSGQDLVEYALLSGIITLAGVLLFPVVAGEMRAAYTTWNSGVQTVWEPCPPGGCPTP
jgi:Flp pilus assembly pilin Flp